MSDVHSKEARSYNMSRIRGMNTKPELIVRKNLHSLGFRYRLHVKDLPGKPDVVLPKYKTVIFVHGCFWHGHMRCKYYILPKTRTEWWECKIQTNIANDSKAQTKLKNEGWKVLVIWECQLKKDVIQENLQFLLRSLKL